MNESIFLDIICLGPIVHLYHISAHSHVNCALGQRRTLRPIMFRIYSLRNVILQSYPETADIFNEHHHNDDIDSIIVPRRDVKNAYSRYLADNNNEFCHPSVCRLIYKDICSL
jgi:hypothetical protein